MLLNTYNNVLMRDSVVSGEPHNVSANVGLARLNVTLNEPNRGVIDLEVAQYYTPYTVLNHTVIYQR